MGITLAVLLLALSGNLIAAEFDLYLLRHAEKHASKPDPGLNRCGQLRADTLPSLLPTASLQAIYSSDYQRTQQTAAPLAQQTQLPVQSYQPRQLEQLAELLLQRQQNAVVVGHSNTTAMLAGLLSGTEIPNLDEQQYDLLFQLHSSANGELTLQLHQQGFTCQ